MTWSTRIASVTVTLCAGLLGGVVFRLIGLPMPWLLGPIIGAAVAAMMGLPSGLPRWLRGSVLVVLGLMIGSTVHQSTLAHIARWPVSMSAVALYVTLCTGGMYAVLRRFGGFDPVTAYFAAAPGGFVAMTVIGGAFGGRERSIALTHAVRVVLVVFTIVLSYHLLLGISASPHTAGPAPVLGWHQWAELTLIGAAGWLLGRLLHLPSSAMLGPLLLFAATRVAGFNPPSMPRPPLLAAEVILGSGIGAGFAGATLRELRQSILISLAATGGMLGLSLAFSLALRAVTGIPVETLFLAFSPGGLSGVSLIALALGIEPAFVTAHNVLRVLLILFAGPLIFRVFKGSTPQT